MYLMAAFHTHGKGSKPSRNGHHSGGATAGIGAGECRATSGNGNSCGGSSMEFGLLEIDENDNSFPWGLMHHSELAQMLNSGLGKTMVIDSRSFLEYNTSTIQQSVNVCCSKLVKRRLQQGKVHVLDLLNQTCNIGADASWDVIVYDQCTEDPSQLTADNFVQVLLHKLSTTFNSVAFLKGGFLAFQASHPSLTESKSSSQRCSTLTSLSQPCMPVSNVGPTRILPFLYLGSQQDSLNQEVAQVNGITYILNVSKTCPQPSFILDSHFHRIPVNDNYCEKLLPYFQEAFEFLDKVREVNGCVLVHCLGGVSRSATLAIAYIMRYMKMSSDEAYRYVKDKRPTISPNFNFLGQLLEYEKGLRQEEIEEEAKKAARAMMEEDGIGGEMDRASPGVMDLHTTSPSSPGPRTAHRSFNVDFPPSSLQSLNMSSAASSSLKFSISQECPFPGPASADMYPDSSQPMDVSASYETEHPLIHRPMNIASDLPPFPGPSSESCPFPGPSPELYSLPGPSYQNRLYSQAQAACFNAAYSQMTSANSTPTGHTSRDPNNPNQGMTPFCDTRLGLDVRPVRQSPVCPVTGFPSPGGSQEDFPESTCPRTGFPGPGHYGSSDSETRRQYSEAATTTGLISSHMTMTKTLTETIFKNSATYHNHSGSNTDLSSKEMASNQSLPGLQSNGSGSCSDLSPKSAQKEQHKSRAGFSLSSVFSSFRWKSRPPTLPLGSPVGPMKDGSRFMKKHAPESSGTGDGRVQLTPVSEAVENCDLINSDTISDSVNESATVSKTSNSEPAEENENDPKCVLNVSASGSSLSNATNLAMASTQTNSTNLSSISTSSAPGCSPAPNSHGISSSASETLHISSHVTKSTRTKLNPKNFTLSLSSPTSDFPVVFGSPHTLPSPGDSNKRKSFLPSSSDSPDKLAKKDKPAHHHAHMPPRTLNLSQGTAGKLKQKFSLKKSFVPPIASPTAAMARLNFSSPSEPSPDSSSLALRSNSQVSADHEGNEVDMDDESQPELSTWSSDGHSLSHLRSEEQKRQTKWKSASSLSVKASHVRTTTKRVEESHSSRIDSFRKQHTDTSLYSSRFGSSSSMSTMSLSSSSSLSKSCTSIASPSMLSSSVSEMSSSNTSSSSSCSVNLQGFSLFPTTSLDKLSFTPCYTKDIVQEFKRQESARLASLDQVTLPSDTNIGPSALDSPMSISSGSSAPSIASSTLSPVESSMTNPFSDSTSGNTYSIGDSSSAFQFSQSQIPSPTDAEKTSNQNFSDSQGTQDTVLSPSSTSEYILSPSSMPQATVAPTTPTLPSPYYCSSSSEPLSPMSLSDSSSSSPIRSPTRNGIASPLPSSISSPVSSLSSPIISSPSFSPLVTSPVSSSSHLAGTASSLISKVVRRDKSKRVMDRPNSIAFSSYPACDLVPTTPNNSAGNSGTQASQDDASEVYMSVSGKRSQHSISSESHILHGRTSWSAYSEREVYKQISAAMESAMLRTQAFTPSSSRNERLAPARVSSRKARSLDDILDSNADDDDFISRGRGGGGRPWSRYPDQTLFEQYRCGLRSGSEPYHSSSSLSSNGSHGSSLEIIQVS